MLILSFIAFISLGLPDGLLGVAWPSIASDFAQPLSRLAALQLCATLGFFLSSTNASRLLQRLGVGRILLFSNILVAAALLCFIFAPIFSVVLLASFILGTGGGAVDAGMNAYCAERFSKEEVVLLHAFFGLGAMSGPMIMRRVLEIGAPWQDGYLITVGFIFLLIILFFFSRHLWTQTQHSDSDDALDCTEDLNAVCKRVRISGILLFLVYTGLEVCAGAWSFTWLTRGRGIGPETAALWVGIYWGGLMAGRLFFGFIGSRWRIRSILSSMIAAVIISTLLLLQPWSVWATLLSMPLLGFSCAPLFPLFVSYTPHVAARKSAPDLIGQQVAAASIGSALIPLSVGIGIEILSLKAIPILLFGLALLLSVLYRLWVSGVPADS